MKRLIVIALFLAAPLLPASAQASCVYNKSPHPLNVNLHCGAACRNTWTIHVDDHACRPGKGGTVWVRVMDPFDDHQINDGVCEVKVDKHGWVSVHQHGKKVTVKSKHKDGSVREECTTTIVRD